MSAHSIWCHFLLDDGAVSEKAIASALAGAKLKVSVLDAAAPSGPGLLFFDRFNEDCYDFVREASRDGLERVLAVGATGEALQGGVAWRLLRAGASDVFAWDPSADPAREVAARFERWAEVDGLVNSPLVEHNLVGESPVWKAVLRRIVEAARFTNASFLITGESGTGKELVARLIHTLDPRPEKRELVTLDCTTVMPELSGSEFFGHDRGAYTGAVGPRDGAFALADGGTLFLDEVGELAPRMQAALLRVVQERTYKRVGSNTWHQTDFRLVCATNRDLLEEEARGHFRRDFYYRIAGWTCRLPPLRERVGDILTLARHFMRQLRPGGEPPGLDETVREYLLRREYPGNVRDLKQLISRIMHRHTGPGPVTAGAIAEEERPVAEGEPPDWRDQTFERAIRRALSLGVGLKEIGGAATEAAIRIAVADEEGNLQRAARRLGVTDRALQMRRAVRRAERPGGVTAIPDGDGGA
jgi:transcriptional regulator with GAF, ATPase, and Fis domain